MPGTGWLQVRPFKDPTYGHCYTLRFEYGLLLFMVQQDYPFIRLKYLLLQDRTAVR